MDKKILLVIQRASDFTEMYRAIEHLNHHGYECIILFYGVGNAEADGNVIKLLNAAKAQKIVKRVVIKGPPKRGTERYSKLFPKWFFFMKKNEKNKCIKPISTPITTVEKRKRVTNISFVGIMLNLIKFLCFIPFLLYHFLFKCIYWIALGIYRVVRSMIELLAIFAKVPLLRCNKTICKIYRLTFIQVEKFKPHPIQIIRKKSFEIKINQSLLIAISPFKYIVFLLEKGSQCVDRFYSYYQTQKFELMKLLDFFLNRITKFLADYFSILPFYFINLNLFTSIIKRLKINLIILPEDVVGMVTPLVIKAGHQNNVPSLIVPYTIANQEEAFQSLKSADAFSIRKFSNKLLGYFCRSWMMRDKNHAALRLPAAYVVGHIFTHTSPPDPWMMNSGYANAIAIENQAMAEYYLRSGISANKLKIVGSFCDDDIALMAKEKQSEIKKLAQLYHFDANKPILLIGGCPNQLIGHPPGFDFSNIEEMVAFITNCLSPFQANYNLIIRPHPNFMELGLLFEKYGWISVTHDTIKLIPLSDMYIAFASATIRWAIASAVPVINYDVFHYDFSEYKQTQGVMNVTLPDEFKKAVENLLNHDFLTLQRSKIKSESKKWGMLDGMSSQRICALIEELMQLNPVPRVAG